MPLSTELRVRPKLLTDLPPDLAKLIEGVQVDNRGRLIPRLYSKERANKELRNMLNISAKEAPRDAAPDAGSTGEGTGDQNRSELQLCAATACRKDG